MHPALRHHNHQCGSLQRNGLSARIGAGDQQQIEVAAQADIDWHYRFELSGCGLGAAVGGDLVHKQRVACLVDLQRPAGGYLRADHVVLQGVLGLGGYRVHPRNGIHRRGNAVGLGDNQKRKFPQQSLDLFPLVLREAGELIVQFDRGVGLDKHRCSGVGGPMHHPGQATAILGFDCQNVPVAVDRHVYTLQEFGDLGAADVALHHVVNAAGCVVGVPANGLQFIRRVIANGSVGGDNAVDGVGFSLEVLDPGREAGQRVQFFRQRPQMLAEAGGAPQRRGDRGKIFAVGPPARRRAPHRVGNIAHAGERQAPGVTDRPDHLRSLLQPRAYSLGAVRRSDCQSQGLAHRRCAKARKQLANTVKLDLVQRERIHTGPSFSRDRA